MRAIKVVADVREDHKVLVELPSDVQPGPAEVIVLVPDDAGAVGQTHARQLQSNHGAWKKEFDEWVASHDASIPIPSAESLRRDRLYSDRL
jgi:hypothetical protein